MMLENVFAVFALIFAVYYMILGLIAYGHQVEEKNLDKGWSLSPIWAMFPSVYDDDGKKICERGRRYFWISTGFTVVWLLLRWLAQ